MASDSIWGRCRKPMAVASTAAAASALPIIAVVSTAFMPVR